MDRKYFNELVHILSKQGIQSAVQRDDNFTILLDGLPAYHVSATSQMFIAPGDPRTSEAEYVYHRTEPIAEMVREYMTAIGNAPLLIKPYTAKKNSILVELFKTLQSSRC